MGVSYSYVGAVGLYLWSLIGVSSPKCNFVLYISGKLGDYKAYSLVLMRTKYNEGLIKKSTTF